MANLFKTHYAMTASHGAVCGKRTRWFRSTTTNPNPQLVTCKKCHEWLVRVNQG